MAFGSAGYTRRSGGIGEGLATFISEQTADAQEEIALAQHAVGELRSGTGTGLRKSRISPPGKATVWMLK